MERRKFLINGTLAAAGSIVMPYLLPTGRLFNPTGRQLSKHVVFVQFAGGVRQQESVLKRYLADSQGLDIEGNIMYNMLSGQAPLQKIVYGTTSPGGQPGGSPISPILSTPLDQLGTLFNEVRYSQGSTGHFGGLSTGVSGHYGTTQGLKQRPLHPTIHEYARRFGGMKATDCWFVGNGIGNSTPLLNHSEHPDFGSKYGANFLCPNVAFGPSGEKFLKGFKVYDPETELDPIRQMTAFLNERFLLNGGEVPNLGNTEEEKQDIKNFIRNTFTRLDTNQVSFPPVTDNGDAVNIGYATEVLRWFKPKILVVNMSAVDSCHSSYSGYLKALHRADHSVAFLWKYIQENIPEMSGNTSMIVMPEHGRNYEHNPITDDNDWFAFDHNSDPNSRRIFTLMVGPNIPAGLKVGSENNPIGDASDVALTMADMLGFKQEVLNTGLVANVAQSLFDRI